MKTNDQHIPRGVSVILYRDGEFCVSQRLSKLGEPLLWQFPGGHVEPGEEPLLAANRELFEETGLDLTLDRFVFLGETPPLHGYKDETYIGVRYGVVLEAGEEPRRIEPLKATDWQWVDPAELDALSMLQSTHEYAFKFALLTDNNLTPP